MKKILFMTVITCLVTGAVCAQGWGSASQPVNVTGTLQLQNGQIALASGDAVYFVPALVRYIGFIEGLKEGARVSIEGYAWGNSLQPLKVNIDGKTYDFSANNNLSQGWGGYGYCGYGPYSSGRYGRGGYGCH